MKKDPWVRCSTLTTAGEHASAKLLLFQAAVDGRQSLSNIVKELPWWASAAGIAVGYELQTFAFIKIIMLIVGKYPFG